MRYRSAIIVIGLLLILSVPLARAQDAGPSSNNENTQVEGMGFGAYDTESIKGFDENKVSKDPVCDRSKRPTITKVEPDEAKPGEKVVIKGENFGTKECLHGVTFSSAPSVKINYTYVNDATIEALVPDAKAGMSFVVIVAGGGSAQSKPVIIKGK
ncbi:MAG TPA: IPT/TIG domain-containing protein [Nitrospiraceae bacterium]|nr:IPT/TIG domain-containing protein [Nitrospiraceae bacterium]